MGLRSFTYCLLFIMPFLSYGQSFQLGKNEIYVEGSIGKQLEVSIPLKNITEEPLSLVIERSENNIGNSQASLICWDRDCADDTSLSKRIEPNKTVNNLRAVLDPGFSVGYSSVKYIIYNKNNPQDAADLIIHYTVEEPSPDDEIYKSGEVTVKDVYPNPVSDFMFINYRVADPSSSVKVGIHNVLGSVVEEFQLEPLESKAKINTMSLNPGVYFYSLSVNNETVLIKKFVVRR